MSAERELSFREMKSQQLAEERGEQQELEEPTQSEAPEVEDVVDADSAIDEEQDTESELDESTEDEEGFEDDEEPEEDYKARYEELEKEYRRVTENRKKREAEHAEAMTQFVQSRHEFEDTMQEAKRGAQYYANLANQQLAQFQNINWSQVPQEQYAGLQQQAMQAQQLAQRYGQELEAIKQWEQEQSAKLRQREAEIALTRIRSAIPEWSNEHYAKLGEFAGERYGVPPDVFAEITDPAYLLMLNDLYKSKKAVEGVKKVVKQRKAKPPASRAGSLPGRNAKGQFKKAEREFQSGKGSFREMKRAQLAMEQGR